MYRAIAHVRIRWRPDGGGRCNAAERDLFRDNKARCIGNSEAYVGVVGTGRAALQPQLFLMPDRSPPVLARPSAKEKHEKNFSPPRRRQIGS